MMAVDIAAEPGLTVGNPRLLFEGPYEQRSRRANYDVSLDDQRFLMVQESDRGSTHLTVVLNWFEELKRRVPVDN